MDKTGNQAEPFELVSVTKQKARLDDFQGGWLWLVFHRHLG